MGKQRREHCVVVVLTVITVWVLLGQKKSLSDIHKEKANWLGHFGTDGSMPNLTHYIVVQLFIGWIIYRP